MRNAVELDVTEAHKFVEKNKRNGFYWDNYTIVKWSPGHNGYSDVNGMFRNGKWGYVNRYQITDKGTWFIPAKYVKHT